MEPLGVEFIKILPDTTAFGPALAAQLSGNLTSVGPKLAAAQAQLSKTAAGLVLPTSVRSVDLTERATARLGTTSSGTASKLAALENATRGAGGGSRIFQHSLQETERSLGRTTRGLVAATAASTGFFRAIAFASGAFLAGAAIGTTIGAAVSEFKDMVRVGATTAAVIRATGGAANVTADQVKTLSTRLQNLSGIGRETVGNAANILLTFNKIRNSAGAMNDVFNRSVKATLDISQVMGVDLAATARQVGKAIQEPTTGMTALRRQGISFSQSQREVVKQLVATGQTLTAQKFILHGIETQVGGTAEAIGRTLPGKLAIMRERARNALGELVDRLSKSKKAADLASGAAAGLSQVYGALVTVVKALGPGLLTITTALTKTVGAVGGAGAVLGLLVAFKGVKVAIGLAAAAQGVYTKAVLVGTGAITAEEAAVLSSAKAFRGQSAAALAGTEVQAGKTAIAIGEMGAASGVAAARVGALSIAAGALTSPLAIAVGVTALAVGLKKLSDIAANAPGSLNATRRALEGLALAIKQTRAAGADVAATAENRSLARLNELAAQRAADAARNRLVTSGAPAGSLERLHLQFQLQTAEQNLRKAQNELTDAETKYGHAVAGNQQTLANQPHLVEKYTQKLQDLANAVRKADPVLFIRGPRATQGVLERSAHAVDLYKQRLDALSKNEPKYARVVGILQNLLATTGKIPTRQQFETVVKLTLEGQSNRLIFDRLLGIQPASAERRRFIVVAQSLEQQRITATTEEQFKAAQANLKTEQKRLTTLKQTAATRHQELQTANEQLITARENVTAAQDQLRAARQALVDSQQALRDARQSLRDTIAEAHQAINDAITSAKSNLDQLGQSIADALDKAGAVLNDTGGGLGARFRQLRDQIIRGQGGELTQIAGQRVNQQLNQQQAPGGGFQQRFADLTDALARGKISLPQFTRQFNALLKSLDINAFRKQFGTAATNLLLDTIRAARRQAALIARGPQRPGGGSPPTVVNPLKEVAAANRRIADAERQVAAAVRGVSNANRDVRRAIISLQDANRKLAEAESKERKANTASIKANTSVTAANTRVQAARLRLEQPQKPSKDKRKPDGSAGATAGAQAGVGGNAP